MNSLESNDPNLDRLSALPDSLIHKILSLLKMRDVVRTSLLSKQWNNLWITTHCLQFEESNKDPNKIRRFVSRALTLWRGTHLQKFSIDILCPDVTASLSSDVDSWVHFATERHVEELLIGYMYSVIVPLYSPPQCLYECSSLKKLSLYSCDLRMHGDVQWDRLNSLDLSFCFFHETVTLNQILASSTQLKIVTLVEPRECKSLSIRSGSLEKLLVISLRNESLGYSYKVTIYAPNLEALQFKGTSFNKYLPRNFSSLTELLLDLTDVCYRPAVGEALCQILPAIQPVVTVKLSAFCLKMLGQLAFSPLMNVKLLRIVGGLAEIRELAGLLGIFPKLKTLIVHWEYDENLFEFNGENYTMSEANILTSSLLQLRTVKIVWTRYQASIFEFIECLLKYATMIEKMVIQKREFDVDDFQRYVSGSTTCGEFAKFLT